jgi:hypothetical protein
MKTQHTITLGHNKGMLRGKSIHMSTHIIKSESSQLTNIMMFLERLEKQEQVKTQIPMFKETIKIRGELKEMVTKNNTKNQ